MPAIGFEDELMELMDYSLKRTITLRRRERSFASRTDLSPAEHQTWKAIREALNRRGKLPTPGLVARLSSFGRRPKPPQRINVLP